MDCLSHTRDCILPFVRDLRIYTLSVFGVWVRRVNYLNRTLMRSSLLFTPEKRLD